MCGIFASLGHSGPPAGPDKIQHRGIRTSCAESTYGRMWHSRLPIVGLGQEWDQPVKRGRWTIGFVGEVLNFRDFKPDAQCDLEVVADAWVEHPRRFREFDGFWSIVALDEYSETIHILVDYLAQKPVYYRDDAWATAAASEPDALAVLGRVTPDEVYFSSVMKWGYCPETWRTPYAEIFKTEPGEHTIVRPNGRSTSKIVDPLCPRQSVLPAYVKAEIEEAVERRVLSSDVPVAALVSGGLDSAITYTLAQRHGDVQPYHVDNDEEEEAKRVVGEDGKIIFRGSDRPHVDKKLKYMQEPIDLGSLGPQVVLSDAIGQAGRERVCLTGDGADEFFGGYSRASRYDSQQSDVFHELVAWHLPRLDRVMMRNRIEVRSPFLARGVAEAALGLPWQLRQDKKVLRDLFRDDLPRGVADTPKKPLKLPEFDVDPEIERRVLVGRFRQQWWS